MNPSDRSLELIAPKVFLACLAIGFRSEHDFRGLRLQPTGVPKKRGADLVDLRYFNPDGFGIDPRLRCSWGLKIRLHEQPIRPACCSLVKDQENRIRFIFPEIIIPHVQVEREGPKDRQAGAVGQPRAAPLTFLLPGSSDPSVVASCLEKRTDNNFGRHAIRRIA
jgi:hypothetical protein